MGNKWGRRSHATQDFRIARSNARASAARRAALEQNLDPCELDAATPPEEITSESTLGFDPQCRFAATGFELGLHVCTNNQGRLVQPGQRCFTETRQQVREQNDIGRVVAEYLAAQQRHPSSGLS